MIKHSADNMNHVISKKYGILPNDIETKSLSSEQFRTKFNLDRIKNSKQIANRLDKYDKKFIQEKPQLCEPLNIGENVLVMAEQIKKKSEPGKFYKQSVQNISYFNEDKIFVITYKRNIENKTFYWLADTKNNKHFNKRFQRHKLFAIENNFM